ncbi:DNA alkylation repair protein [Cohnella herbarum]|uniref:DNA alkylation repair protein n=1 Tax=Cohnella herbarum TaxID=2728023 RepID=A0A7Z2ZJW0_9BACL|nr:DNA alkylation repair protein [Cohnella herbarum]QJD82190.1 DNA alkylation repair protein [Cohnella herbarum]
MKSYVDHLAAWFRQHADPGKAKPMENYMRNQYPFLGLKTPERTSLTKQFWAEYGIPAGEELLAVVLQLWQLPEREFQNVAMAFLEKYGKQSKRDDIDVFETLVTTKSWWDTVDYLASHTMGDHLMRYPELIPEYTERWMKSDDFWLRRTAILYQLRYRERTDAEKLFEYIRQCKDDNEFFIRKAIGWALREYSKTDEASVRRFVAETSLSPLSTREALKFVSRRNDTTYSQQSESTVGMI